MWLQGSELAPCDTDGNRRETIKSAGFLYVVISLGCHFPDLPVFRAGRNSDWRKAARRSLLQQPEEQMGAIPALWVALDSNPGPPSEEITSWRQIPSGHGEYLALLTLDVPGNSPPSIHTSELMMFSPSFCHIL